MTRALERQSRPHAGLHHLRVVNPAPAVAPIRHVAVLALPPLPRGRARSPLLVRVLQGLAVQARAARPELVAGRAELRPEICRGVGGAVVWELLTRHAKALRAGPRGRTKALVPTHVAARAHDALALQR